MTVPVLIISGPVGVGKTTVAYEMFDQLAAAAVSHGVVDLDRLAVCWPWDTVNDPFNERLMMANLAAVWSNYSRQGVTRLVVPYVVEDRLTVVVSVRRAVPGADVTICGLVASDDTLRARVAKRESGSSAAKLTRRSLELSMILRESASQDFTVATDGRTVADIAREIIERLGWRD
jgi:chloramphenicol 3-O-phosphotransferase